MESGFLCCKESTWLIDVYELGESSLSFFYYTIRGLYKYI